MAERRPSEGGTRIDPRGHTAVFGAGPTALAATAVEVFGAARDTGEAFLFMTDDPDPADLAELPGRDTMLRSGRLRLVSSADAYPHQDPERLLAAFDETLHGVLADGWTGMRVVADNTTLARGSDGAFADWLRWEHVTHRWQTTHAAVGVCWFDADEIGPDRVAQLASVHPHAYGEERPPAFRLVAAERSLRLLGDVDPHEVQRLVGLLAHTPHDGELTVDLAGVGYLHHTLFAALESVPASVERIRLIGARQVVRRVFDVVAGPAGRVELV